jgi:hypothetical protein
LQRLSTKANVGSDGSTLRLVIPKSTASLRVLLAGRPLAHATVLLTHHDLRWETELTTDDDGRFAGALWEPGVYGARIGHEAATPSPPFDVHLSAEPVRARSTCCRRQGRSA